LDQVSAAAAAGIDLIQIREKQLTARALFELTERAVSIARSTSTKILVNDRADIAKGAGADGVHLTTQSLDATAIRRVFGDELVIGASTHSLIEVENARAAGADFVVFGPVFETVSKRQYGPPVGLEALGGVTRTDFPVIALGGVSIDNAGHCFQAGAAGLAGISLFSNLPELEATVAALRREYE
jgi:thiamine-phosphate pyrophosphorylase